MTAAFTVLSPPRLYTGARQIGERDEMHNAKVLIVGGLAVLGVGCGSSGPPANTGKAPTGPGASAYRYADCMRSHGVSNFPNPRVSVDGNRVSVMQAVPASDAAAPKFKSAQKACQGIIPGPGSEPDQQSHRLAFLSFARCMRDHGVSGFPDPNSQGRITAEMLSAAGVELTSRFVYRAAIRCAPVTHGLITPAQVAQAANGPH